MRLLDPGSLFWRNKSYRIIDMTSHLYAPVGWILWLYSRSFTKTFPSSFWLTHWKHLANLCNLNMTYTTLTPKVNARWIIQVDTLSTYISLTHTSCYIILLLHGFLYTMLCHHKTQWYVWQCGCVNSYLCDTKYIGGNVKSNTKKQQNKIQNKTNVSTLDSISI